MTLKLTTGMIYDQQELRKAKALLNRRGSSRPRKRLKLPQFKLQGVRFWEIARSFAISMLVMMNLILVIAFVAWFGLILSFIPPAELLSMYGVESYQAEQLEGQLGLEESMPLPAPAPALGGS